MNNSAFVIGYKNHAERIIRELIKTEAFRKIYVYHPEIHKKVLSKGIIQNVLLTDDFQTVKECLCVFICSPSKTHVEYLEKIVQLEGVNVGKPYIYCEKPIGVSKEDVDWLKKHIKILSARMFVGFNQIFSDFSSEVSRILKSGEFGLPISATFEASHGLAFKKDAEKNWRFTDQNIFSTLIGNLGIHYIHLSLSFFGPVDKIHLIENKVQSSLNNDVSLLSMRHKSGVLTSIFLSYSTIYSKRQNIFFTDGSICLIDNHLTLNSPRDTFNKDGEFINPPKTEIRANFSSRDSTLEIAIKGFIDNAFSGKKFSKEDYLRSMEAVELVLNIKKDKNG